MVFSAPLPSVSPLDFYLLQELSFICFHLLTIVGTEPCSLGSTAQTIRASQVALVPPAMQETWVWFLGWEDPLEEGMETYSSSLAWRIPWTEEPGGLESMGSQRVRHNWSNLGRTHAQTIRVRNWPKWTCGCCWSLPFQISSVSHAHCLKTCAWSRPKPWRIH